MPQQGHHLAAKAAYLTVGQNGLEAISDFHSILVVGSREKDENTTVVTLRADAPPLVEFAGKVLGRDAFECPDRHESDLRVSLPVQFRAERGKLSFDLGVDNAGEVVNVALRLKLLELFRPGTGLQKKRNGDHENGSRRGSAQG